MEAIPRPSSAAPSRYHGAPGNVKSPVPHSSRTAPLSTTTSAVPSAGLPPGTPTVRLDSSWVTFGNGPRRKGQQQWVSNDLTSRWVACRRSSFFLSSPLFLPAGGERRADHQANMDRPCG